MLLPSSLVNERLGYHLAAIAFLHVLRGAILRTYSKERAAFNLPL